MLVKFADKDFPHLNHFFCQNCLYHRLLIH